MRGKDARRAALHDALKKRRDPSNSRPVASKRGRENGEKGRRHHDFSLFVASRAVRFEATDGHRKGGLRYERVFLVKKRQKFDLPPHYSWFRANRNRQL
jgi:hypothetical protein